MKKISGSTFYFKKFFPAMWFGGLSFFLVSPLLLGGNTSSPMFFVVPILMMVIGYLMFRKTCWDLADEVFDNDSELLFRRGGQEQRVDLQDIVNISYTHTCSPERIVLTVRSDGPIGKELVFTPPLRFNPFSKSPLVNELIERVDQARSRN